MRSRYGVKFIATMILLTGIGALLFWAFMEGRKELATEQERERPVKAASRVSAQEGEIIVTIDPAVQKKSGIAAEPVESTAHQEKVKAYGMVLQTQDLVDARNRYVKAKADAEKSQAGLETSRKAYERLKTLHETNRNISDKAFQSAEQTWRSDEADAGAAQESFQSVEGTVRQQWGRVLAGWLFDGSKDFDRLIRQQAVLIQITLPSGTQVSSAPPNASVQIEDGTLIHVTLVSPSPRTDPRIQGRSFFYIARARARSELIEGSLLPGMNVVAYLPFGPKVRGVVVPASAVVWWQGNAWVYVQRSTDRFIRQEISTQQPVEGGWFISKKLKTGDRIVVRGAQLLLSEEFRAQIQVGEEGGGK